MTLVYEVSDDGTSHEVEVTRESLSSNGVYCVVDNSKKSIYLWMGTNSDVRKKFVGAQTASRLRNEQGTGFRVRPLEEGEEPSGFLSTE